MRPPFREIWQRIRAHEGQAFRQHRGKEFTYRIVRETTVHVDDSSKDIPKSQFEQAFGQVPVRRVSDLGKWWGSTTLYAILMDERIRQQDW